MPSTPPWVSKINTSMPTTCLISLSLFPTFFWFSSLPFLLNIKRVSFYSELGPYSLTQKKTKLKCLEFDLSTNMKISVKIPKELTKLVCILGLCWQSLGTDWVIYSGPFRNTCPADMGIQKRWPAPVICCFPNTKHTPKINKGIYGYKTLEQK